MGCEEVDAVAWKRLVPEFCPRIAREHFKEDVGEVEDDVEPQHAVSDPEGVGS